MFPKALKKKKSLLIGVWNIRVFWKIFFDAKFVFPGPGDMDEGDFLLIVGKDSKSIKQSDLIIINAEERLGVGTAQEMMIAKYFGKLVITVLPKNSYHRRTNVLFQGKYLVEDWMHPFIYTFSDFVVEKLEDIEQIKDQIFNVFPKNLSIIDKAVSHRESKSAEYGNNKEKYL